jgi:putative ABC transport system substrate-binding protein
MKRTGVILPVALAFGLFAVPLAAGAQPETGKVPRIGILSPSSANAGRVEAIRQGLRALGYIEGRSIAIEHREAKTEADLPALATELVRLGVDIIATAGSASIRPAMQATKTIPIVMVADNADPVVARYVASYARPGGNVTGLTGLSPDVTAKRMELLKEAIPGMSRVAVLRNSASPDRESLWSETTSAARALGLQLQALDVATPGQLESLFEAAVRQRAQGIIVIRDPLTNTLRPRIIALATQHRLPAMYASREFVDAGGLMVYGSNVFDLYRRTAVYIDKILRGAKPSELPVERAEELELVINLKAAKAIGLIIPPSVLARADEVIQ